MTMESWPAAVSPWQVCITALDVEADGEVMQVATQIHEELNTAGIDNFDDRELRPGIKFMILSWLASSASWYWCPIP